MRLFRTLVVLTSCVTVLISAEIVAKAQVASVEDGIRLRTGDGPDDSIDIDLENVKKDLKDGSAGPTGNSERYLTMVELPHVTPHTYSEEELAGIVDSLAEGEVLCNCTEETSRQCGIGRFQNICRTRGGCSANVGVRSEKIDNVSPYLFGLSCLTEPNYSPRSRPFMCHVADANRHVMDIQCCHDSNFCNGRVRFTLTAPPTTQAPPVKTNEHWTYILVVLLFVLFMVLLVASYFVIRRLRMLKIPDEKEPFLLEEEKNRMDNLKVLQNLLAEAAGEYTNSGSGSGLPVLVQRTIARQIELQGKHPIGTGRFGEVWLGLWKGEKVAVKIFHSFEEKSWFREVEIYQTNMLRHSNIVGFIASDNKDTGVYTQLWLVTEYHKNGSLYDYLMDSTITVNTLVRMVESVAAGLAFLHSEIEGTHCKPAIAHRDLKSKNILVKSDLSCCIADLGMAVRYTNQVLELPSGSRVGTRRYLAPEVLDGSLQEQQFDAYRRADVYSFGLVMWEMMRRTDVNGKVFEYDLPYFEHVGIDPSQEEMLAVVVDQKIRPTVDSAWLTHPTVNAICDVMAECWRMNPTARLTALRVRKTVLQIEQKLAEAEANPHLRSSANPTQYSNNMVV